MSKLNIPFASEYHQSVGWVLDYNSLIDIQERIKAGCNYELDTYPSLEEIEMVLLASARMEHLIKVD